MNLIANVPRNRSWYPDWILVQSIWVGSVHFRKSQGFPHFSLRSKYIQRNKVGEEWHKRKWKLNGLVSITSTVSITPPSVKCLLPILQLLSNTAEGFSLQKDIEVSFRSHFTSQRNQTSLVGTCTLVTVTIKKKFGRRENTRNQCVRGNIFFCFFSKKGNRWRCKGRFLEGGENCFFGSLIGNICFLQLWSLKASVNTWTNFLDQLTWDQALAYFFVSLHLLLIRYHLKLSLNGLFKFDRCEEVPNMIWKEKVVGQAARNFWHALSRGPFFYHFFSFSQQFSIFFTCFPSFGMMFSLLVQIHIKWDTSVTGFAQIFRIGPHWCHHIGPLLGPWLLDIRPVFHRVRILCRCVALPSV